MKLTKEQQVLLMKELLLTLSLTEVISLANKVNDDNFKEVLNRLKL